MIHPTQSRLHEQLSYDGDTGHFFWRKKTGRCAAGQRAGRVGDHGYELIQVDGRAYRSHVLAWIYVYGHPPTNDIDHRDQDRRNNRLINLRLATRSQNNANSKVREGKLYSDKRGVSFDRARGLWVAQIRHDKRQHNLGRFASEEEAAAAYAAAYRAFFGEFAVA